MPRYEETRTYGARTSADCFEVAKQALPEAGFDVWKTRPIAWLVLSRRKEDADTIHANVSCLAAGRMTLAMGADTASEEALKAYAHQIFSACEARLSKKP